MRFQSLLIALFIFVLTLNVPRAFAAKGYGGGSGTRGNGGGSTSTDSPPPVDHSASIAARQDVTAATVEVNKANQAVAAIVLKLRKDFEQTVDWKKVQSDLAAARSDLDIARTQVLKDLAGKPDYHAATSLKQKAEAERAALGTDASPEDRSRITTALLEVDQRLLDFEQVSLAASPAAHNAQAALTEAKGRTTQMLKAFDGSVKENAEWQAANAASGEKKQALVNAQKSLTVAIAQEAQAKR